MLNHAPVTSSTRTRQTGRWWFHWGARAAISGVLAGDLLLAAAPAQAATTSSTGRHPTSGTDRVFHADNGIELSRHY